MGRRSTIRIMRTTIYRQEGVVSLMVTMVMMIVITLIVLGFAAVIRDTQRNTLDNQLSTQAFYAAESGINDARVVINNAVKAGSPVPAKTKCDNNDGGYNLSGTVNAQYDVAYTCVLVDPAPTSLSTDVSYNSKVLPIISGGPAFSTLQLSWSVSTGLAATASGCATTAAGADTLPVAGGGQWACHYPILRVDVFDANGALNRANWGAATATMFLVPINSTTVTNSTTLPAARGNMVTAQCTAAACVAKITNLAGTRYYMRVSTVYRSDSRLTIDAGGTRFVGAQAVIDATGRALDVIKRVVVAVDLTDANSYAVPSGAIISEDSICKRFAAANGSYFAVPSDADMNSAAGANGNPLCLQHTSASPPQP